MINAFLSLLNNPKDIFCCRVRTFVMLTIILWTIYSTEHGQNLGILMGTYVADFVFVMRNASCSLFLTIIKLRLLKHLALPKNMLVTNIS